MSALVPLQTAVTRLFGGATRNSVQSIYVEAKSSTTLSAADQEASTVLDNDHHLSVAATPDYTITSQQSLLTTATSVSKTLTVLLGGIAGLS
uniref:hypothetical protein n=1 Tax=Acinetobacter baumannii TaxID=470 RepID=UPI001BB46A3A